MGSENCNWVVGKCKTEVHFDEYKTGVTITQDGATSLYKCLKSHSSLSSLKISRDYLSAKQHQLFQRMKNVIKSFEQIAY